MPLSPNMRAALFMTVSMAGFTLNDGITKHASEVMNMGQVMFVRGAFATLFIAALAWHQGALANLRLALQPMVLLRVVGEMMATVTFLIALAQLPIANVSAVLQALPLAVTMGAALIYGETVGWRRWLAIAAGFAGVAIIVQARARRLQRLFAGGAGLRRLLHRARPRHQAHPRADTDPADLDGDRAGGFRLRRLPDPADGRMDAIPARSTFSCSPARRGCCSSATSSSSSPCARARSPSSRRSATPACFSRSCSASLIFGDVPDLAMILGSAIIVGSGLYMLYRERVVGRSKAAAESVGPSMAPDGL